nr:hypothetical protein [Desulfobacula sp.]
MPEIVGKDFNDLHVEHGLDEVRNQLSKFIDVDQSFKTQIKIDLTADAVETMQASGIDHRAVVNAAYEGQKGCANMLANLNRDIFCYDRAGGLWYEFSGHHWELDKLGKIICSCDMIQKIFKRSLAEIEAAILEIASEIRQANDEQKRQLQTQIKKLEGEQKAIFATIHNLNNLSYRKQVVEFAAHGSDSLGITGEEWDQKPWALAVKSGSVNLKTGELKPGKAEDFIKSPCPTDYDPSATCPAFEKFLLDVFDGDMNTVDFCG